MNGRASTPDNDYDVTEEPNDSPSSARENTEIENGSPSVESESSGTDDNSAEGSSPVDTEESTERTE